MPFTSINASDQIRDTRATINGMFSELYGWGDHAAAGYITGYTVTESDVTSHQAALTITESQISDLQAYLTDVSQGAVTAHQGALSITRSQVSDFGSWVPVGGETVPSVAGLTGAITAAQLRTALGVEAGAAGDQTGPEIVAAINAQLGSTTWQSGGGGGGGAPLTQEQVQDFAGALVASGTQTLVSVTYDDANNEFDIAVDSDLSNYDNSTSAFITAAQAPVQAVAGETGNVSAAALRTALNVEDGAQVNRTPAQIKTDYEANANTNALTDALLTKINGIEAGATGDMTGGEIATAYEAVSGVNRFTDADHTKLDGIAAGAEVNTIDSNPAGITGATRIQNVVWISQADYDNLVAPDPNTLFVIN